MSEETANFHARYLYRGYLQVVECDLTGKRRIRAQLHLGPLETGGCAHPDSDGPGSERDAK